MIIKKLIFAFLTLTIINATQAMEQGALAISGKDTQMAVSPTIPLVIKTAASIEAQRQNPPPPLPPIKNRRPNFKSASNSKSQPTTPDCVIN